MYEDRIGVNRLVSTVSGQSQFSAVCVHLYVDTPWFLTTWALIAYVIVFYCG